jgi:hypothetical protein
MTAVLRAIVNTTAMSVGYIAISDFLARRVQRAYKYAKARHKRRQTRKEKKS